MKVDIVLDIACAWSALGYTRFQRAAALFREAGGTLRVDFHPFQLVPDADPKGRPLAAVQADLFGPSAAARAERMARLAAHDGLTMNFGTAVFTNTFEAHRLVSLAAEHDRAEAMVARLFRAYFTDGLNVGDPAVLEALAAETGVPWDAHSHARETRDDFDFVRRSGIAAIPVFHFADGTTCTGAHTVEELADALANAAWVAA